MFSKQRVQLSEAAMGRKLFFLVTGSRGDVQPLVALAAGCKKAGFEVLVATRNHHLPFFEDFGVPAVDCDYLDKARGRIDRSPGRWTPCAQNHEDHAVITPGVLRSMYEFAADFAPDVILSGLPCLPACHALAEKLGVPAMECSLQNNAPTGEQTSPYGEPAGLPGCCHYILWLAYRRRSWRLYRRTQLPVLRALLQTPGVPCSWGTLQAHLLDTVQPLAPTLVSLSPSLETLPKDAYPTSRGAALCNYLVVTRQEQLTKADHMFGCRAVLRAFVDAGDPPLYIGWGPVVDGTPAAMTALAVGCAEACGRRAVVLCGDADLAPGLLVDCPHLQRYAEASVLFVRSAPHEWLFPQCCAVLHHGGVGTTACALRSGVPSVVTACTPDQQRQGRLVCELKMGVALGPLRHLSVAQLAAAVRSCLSDKALLDRCKEVSELLQKEDGMKASIQHIDNFLKSQVATGGWRLMLERRRREKALLKERGPDGCLPWLRRIAFREHRSSYAPSLRNRKAKPFDSCWSLSCCALLSMYHTPKKALAALGLPAT